MGRSTPVRLFSRAGRFGVTVGAADIEIMRRIAASNPPAVIDRGLPLLTRAADRSVLWMGVSAALAATGRTQARRAAVRGMLSIGATSLVANQVAKRLVYRKRPLIDATPARRVAFRVPRSNSFPSGHSASAAAFAVAVGSEVPALAVPVGALAGAVAFSRVYTGVHFPSDVVAGVALGAGVAALGTLLVPPGTTELERPGAEPSRPQPPRSTGKGVVVVVNPRSGSSGEHVSEQLRDALPDAEVVELDEDADVPAVFAGAAQRADVLAVAGGDGTIRCAAEAAMRADVPLLVVPAGTYNHFARDLDLAEVDDAVEALASGRAVAIDVGEVAGKAFLNTASVGSYPEFVEMRERWEGRLGKPLAAALAMAVVARRCPPIEVDVDGKRHELVMFFAGNGAYVPRGFVPRGRLRLDSGVLDVRLLDARRGGSLTRAFFAAMSADLRRSRGYSEHQQRELTVRLLGGDQRLLARDGEVDDAPDEVHFAVRPAALTVYRGKPATRPGVLRRRKH